VDGYVELTLEKLTSREGINELNRMLNKLFEHAVGDGDTVRVYKGYGSPENVIAASIGSLYQRLDGSTSTTLYVKTSGTGATGWTAK
jgi:hypothetical protein